MALDLKRIARSQYRGKALPSHPAFRDGAPTTTYVPGGTNQRKRGELSQREARQHLQAYGGAEAIDWVMDCVDLFADTTSSAKWHFQREGESYYLPDDQDRPDGAPVVEEGLARLFTAPNPYVDYIEMMQLLVIDLLLVGNAYWYKYRSGNSGRPLSLYRLSPLHVKVRPGSYGVEKYVYAPPGQTDKLEIPANQVVHFKRPNPHDPWYGLGVIKGGGRPLDLELSLTDATAHFFENKADPSLIVQSERRIPRDVFRNLSQQLRSRASGTRNSGELLVLQAGLKAMTLDRNARDAMYKELADSSRNRILAMFRVSPKLLGISEAAGGQDKVQDSRREFDNKVIRPFLDKLQSRISSQLTAAWGYRFVIDYKYVMPPEELVKLASDLGAVPGIKVREVRTFLVEGGIIREPGTGDAEIDELVLNLPGEEAGEDGFEEGFADRPLPREAGRPPLGENTRAIPKGALPPGTRARRPSGKGLTVDQVAFRLLEMKALPVLEPRARSTVGNRLPGEVRPDALESARTRQVDALVSEGESEILRAVSVLERGLLDHVEGKAFNPGALASRVRRSEAWVGFESLLGLALRRLTRAAAATAAAQQLAVEFNEGVRVDYDEVATDIVSRPDGVKSVVANFRDQVSERLDAVLSEGAEKQAVDAAVREAIGIWRDGKAQTVALTEATHAYNESSLRVFEQSGTTEVLVYDGDDHDKACREANGSIWTISEARERRVQHPNCRRAFARA